MSQLESRMGYSFRNPTLLEEALTHSSYSNKHGVPSNERLEFLGDRILCMVIAEHLFKKCPTYEVGELHTVQCALENNKTLAVLAREILQLEKELKYLSINGSSPSENMLADFLEALIGAIYLDGGIYFAREFIFRHFNFEKDGSQVFKVARKAI